MFSHFLTSCLNDPTCCDVTQYWSVKCQKNKNKKQKKLRRSFPAVRVLLLLRRVCADARPLCAWCELQHWPRWPRFTASTRTLCRRVLWERGVSSFNQTDPNYPYKTKRQWVVYFGGRGRKSWWLSLRQTCSLYSQTMRVAKWTVMIMLLVEVPQSENLYFNGRDILFAFDLEQKHLTSLFFFFTRNKLTWGN